MSAESLPGPDDLLAVKNALCQAVSPEIAWLESTPPLAQTYLAREMFHAMPRGTHPACLLGLARVKDAIEATRDRRQTSDVRGVADALRERVQRVGVRDTYETHRRERQIIVPHPSNPAWAISFLTELILRYTPEKAEPTFDVGVYLSHYNKERANSFDRIVNHWELLFGDEKETHSNNYAGLPDGGFKELVPLKTDHWLQIIPAIHSDVALYLPTES